MPQYLLLISVIVLAFYTMWAVMNYTEVKGLGHQRTSHLDTDQHTAGKYLYINCAYPPRPHDIVTGGRRRWRPSGRWDHTVQGEALRA